MAEDEQYAVLRDMAEAAETVEVPSAIVREMLAERDALRGEWYDARNERDRLRQVVDAAMLLWYATYPTGNASSGLIAARQEFEKAAATLDVSPCPRGDHR